MWKIIFAFEYLYLYLNKISTYLYLNVRICICIWKIIFIVFVFVFEKSENLYLYLKKNVFEPSPVTDMQFFNVSTSNPSNPVLHPIGLAPTRWQAIIWNDDRLVYWVLHWGRDKMADIFQTAFWNGFSWMKMYEFRLKSHWNLFLTL